jgi:hypothetical protein
MTNKLPSISAFVMKADIAKKILYKNDFTLFHLEQYYKAKNYDVSYYESVKDIREENINPFYFLENYNKGNYIDAFKFWDFDFEPTIKCTCGFVGNEIDLITNDNSCPSCDEKEFFNNNLIMKPYVDLNGKAKWSLFWGDKVKKKIKKFFKKSARKKVKIDDCQD